jgi:hypothetical protein
MCEECHEECDEDYDGDSIEAKRRQAIRSIIERHPELGLGPEDVTFRFAPKAEERCVRVNMTGQAPQYELHVPSYMAQAMSSSPPLSLLATASWIETETSYDAVCDILEIRPNLSYDAFFVSEKPPLNPVRADAAPGVQEFEEDIQEHLADETE